VKIPNVRKKLNLLLTSWFAVLCSEWREKQMTESTISVGENRKMPRCRQIELVENP
jgi:hypothetical protein